MKKKIFLLLALLAVLLLTGCSGFLKPASPTPEPAPTAAPTPTPPAEITMLLSSEEFQSYSCMDAEKKLRLMGFDSIRLSEYADLSSTDADRVDKIHSISIGGKDRFSMGERFRADSEVVLEYHVVRKLALPASPEEIKVQEATEAARLFTEAGFTNVSTEVIEDLDAEADPVVEALVDGKSDFARSDKVPFDAEIRILTHVYAGPYAHLTELTPEQIYARCAPAVFYVEIYDAGGWCIKTGSGFFLSSDGLAITNYHVISGADSAYITVSDTGEVYPVAGVYDYSAAEDWAVLQIDGSGFQTLEIGDPGYDVGGATVYAIGSPLGLQNTISAGIISNPARVDGGMTYIQMSAAISPGSSGGALLNKYGQVIGITSATYTDGQNLNLSIPLTYLEGMDTDSYVPLHAAQDSPSGTLTLSDTRLILGLGETGSVTITAIEQNCDETVSVRYVIGDEEVVSCSWAGWVGDDNTLNVTPKKIGNTDVTVYFLISGTDTVLDAKTFSVTVTADGSDQISDDSTVFSVDRHVVNLSLFGDSTVMVHGYTDYIGDPNHQVFVTYYIGDSSIVSCAWGSWEGNDIPLNITPLASGSTEITLVYHLEDDTVLAQEIVTVNVIYGAISFSEDELGLAVGESVTLTVSCRLEGCERINYRWEVYGDQILGLQWGDWQEDGLTRSLTVTAAGSGEADLQIWLEDSETLLILDCASIPVSAE
jgi:hypothetical protein